MKFITKNKICIGLNKGYDNKSVKAVAIPWPKKFIKT